MAALTSQVGRKILTGVTGVLLVLFIVVHLLGNLQLLDTDPDTFNAYGKKLHDLGIVLYIIEAGLGAVILLHAIIGVNIFLRRRKARSTGYAVSGTKALSKNRQSRSSRWMIVTGLVLLAFIVIHLLQFRFAPVIETTIDGEIANNLHARVMDLFSNVWWVLVYIGVMVLLLFHLRHGIWSMLQSLGAIKPKWSKTIHGIALLIGSLVAIGFIILPVIIYVRQLN